MFPCSSRAPGHPKRVELSGKLLKDYWGGDRNDEARMSNDERSSNAQIKKTCSVSLFVIQISSFLRHSSFVIRHLPSLQVIRRDAGCIGAQAFSSHC